MGLEWKTESPPALLTLEECARIFTESFALSQGQSVTGSHSRINAWVRSYYGRTVGNRELFKQSQEIAKASVRTTVLTKSELEQHKDARGLEYSGEFGRSIGSNFNYQWNEFVSGSWQDAKPRMDAHILAIADDFLMQDMKYLESQAGRPGGDKRRGKFLSFLIDIVILQKGTGDYTYVRFSQYFKPLLEAIRTLVPRLAQERRERIYALWIRKNEPSDEERREAAQALNITTSVTHEQ